MSIVMNLVLGIAEGQRA